MKHPRTLSLKLFKGINNVLPPESTPTDFKEQTSFLKVAENIDIDKSGGVSKRKGYTLVDSANYSSFWSSDNSLGCYAVRNGHLVRLDSNFGVTTLDSNIGNLSLSFDEIDDKIFFNSASYNGIIYNGVNYGWGVEKNTLAPTLTAIPGSLPAGTYQVGFTYVNSRGIEGGVSTYSSITVPNNSGISLSIPTSPNPELLFAKVYCSTQDGNELYFAQISLLGSVVTITSQDSLINPIQVFGLDAAPKGHLVAYYRGRIYVAVDNILFYSQAFAYEHFDLSANYFEFPERIKAIMPVEDGIWIGSDRLYYLSGEDALTFKRSTKEYVKVVEGTPFKVSGSYIHLDNTPIGYKWLVTTDSGIFILFNQGLTINMTSANVALEQADRGAGLFIEESGINRYLSILKTNNQPNNAVMGDLVETQIIRNGIVIT